MCLENACIFVVMHVLSVCFFFIQVMYKNVKCVFRYKWDFLWIMFPVAIKWYCVCIFLCLWYPRFSWKLFYGARACFPRSSSGSFKVKIQSGIPEWRLLSPFPQSPQKLSFRSPPVVPVCHKAPGRSGKNWIFWGWMAVVSHSAPVPDQLHCGQKQDTSVG